MTEASTQISFLKSPYFSLKHTNYFPAYDELLLKFVGQPMTFIEIGVLDGGSLFMWRDFFGDKARIIGIDMNPSAIKWRVHGFEIFIGNQSDPIFWKEFFEKVGNVDVLVDDGGHRNDQQLVTTLCSLPHIRDGGMIVVEDTQTSFMKFESFKKFTFVNVLKSKINLLYARSSDLNFEKNVFSNSVHSIQFFESICVLHIDRTKCQLNMRIENSGIKDDSQDFRYENDSIIQSFFRKLYDFISIDYLPKDRQLRHPLLAKWMKHSISRQIARIAIIPIRAVIYWWIKLLNLLNLKRVLGKIGSTYSPK
jgi:hypothetical protein